MYRNFYLLKIYFSEALLLYARQKIFLNIIITLDVIFKTVNFNSIKREIYISFLWCL